MLISSLAIPAEAFASAARPLIGLGIFAALLVVFKPLVAGMLHAAMLVITPRKPLEERKAREKFQGILMLNRMARQYDSTQPNLAAELRSLAARD
ncbi:MAG: hypothetical protein A3I66_05790 [Burkholderiales bacterium RIFCSPLOWO2_02_FULL_57_36]|nr:MAG: hypothetical protein A3I66_05790 [Burkholderiales bacterium RIFCSPLOWO2_02_FULL_57_36]